MKVLLTGSMGNVGSNCLRSLLRHNHEVRCFDIRSKANERRFRSFVGRVEMFWGDITRPDDVAAIVKDIEAVIHLGFMLPPLTDEQPERAEAVNVEGTRLLIEAARQERIPPRFIFGSSFSVYGETQHLPPPRKATEPTNPSDNYTRHKIACEAMTRNSGLDWCIVRLGVVPPRSIGGFSPKMFDAPPGARIEFAHPDDVGLALNNCICSEEVWGRVLLIGGGPGSQLYYRDFVNGMLEGMRLGSLPDRAFTTTASAFTDWLDTVESQELLQYQQHCFNDFIQEMRSRLGLGRYLMPLLAPLVRWWMLRQSPYYKASQRERVQASEVAQP